METRRSGKYVLYRLIGDAGRLKVDIVTVLDVRLEDEYSLGYIPGSLTIQAAEAGGLKFAKLVDMPPYHYGVVFPRPPS